MLNPPQKKKFSEGLTKGMRDQPAAYMHPHSPTSCEQMRCQMYNIFTEASTHLWF